MILNKFSHPTRSVPSFKPLLRSGAMLLACCSLFLTLAGCHSSPTTDSVSSLVKGSMQKTFDTDPDFAPAHFKVDKVTPVKSSETDYSGTATIQYQGQPHVVPVSITVASNGDADWKIAPGVLNFATVPAPTPAPAPAPDQQ
jgi:hypothetical protein